ncbi:hypothetical protein LTR22_027148 [Elasticomyces elasticus]|nr:hypothetical protein LTR22_027148 [Elasticomyces elasticus]
MAKEMMHMVDFDGRSTNHGIRLLGTFTIDKWIYVTNIYEIHEIRRYSPHATILYILANNNYPRLVETLRSEDVWLRLPEERYQSPIIAAFANGHQAVLQGLLRDGRADLVNDIVKDPGFGKSFQLRPDQDLLLWVVKNNNQNLAECLLNSHASRGLFSINSKTRPGPAGRETLSLAALHGARSVVQLLLDRGADVNAQSRTLGNALYAALKNGHEKIVQILLDRGADVNAQCHISVNGHEELVQLLLDKGADINAPGGSYGNALQAASLKGDERVVQLRLDQGADINAPGGSYGNALQAASLKGHERVVQVLLDRGANVNAPSGSYGNALYAASEMGHENVVQLLLHRGADVNAQSGHYGNAFYPALANGHEKVVQVLLDKGADVNRQVGAYDNTLQAASSGGHKRVVKADHGVVHV